MHLIGIEPGRLLTTEARLPGVRMRHDHLVEREGEGEGERTVIRNRMYLLGPASSVGRKVQLVRIATCS